MENEVIDIELAKNVFGNNEAMFKRYLFQFEDRNLFGQIKEFLGEGKIQDAFGVAHTMKGLVQNLSLKELAEATVAVVEKLRDGNEPEEEEMRQLEEKYNKAVEYIRYVKENNLTIF